MDGEVAAPVREEPTDHPAGAAPADVDPVGQRRAQRIVLSGQRDGEDDGSEAESADDDRWPHDHSW